MIDNIVAEPARDNVFNTPELLERIIGFLPATSAGHPDESDKSLVPLEQSHQKLPVAAEKAVVTSCRHHNCKLRRSGAELK
jgi:hypothetical protein